MKIRYLILAIIFSIVGIFGIFFLKNYFFYSQKNLIQVEQQITKISALDFLKIEMNSFRDYSGNKFDSVRYNTELENFSNSEKLIFHFWASWCDPCVNEIPELLDYLKRNEALIKSKKLQIVFISLDYDTTALNKFLKSFPEVNSKNYFQVWDTEGLIQKKFGIDRLPSTFIFESNDKVQKYFTVVNWNLF